MRKLLSGNFARLWKSRVFWVLEGFSFGFGVFAYALVAYNTRNLGQGWLEYEAHGYFYLWVLYIAVIIALFACFFIGTDYSDGTVRNKMIVGHSREEIYLSFLLTTITAAFFFVFAYLLAVLLVGLPLSGNVINLSTHVPSIVVIARSAATWQSVFSLVTCSKSGRCKGNGLPRQCAHWLAMTGKSGPGSLS